jgi:putative tricarboxylic transport membrane protein
MKKETRLSDFIVGIVCMLLGVVWFYQANQMMKVELGIGPGDYPKFIAVGLFSMGLLQAAKNLIKGLSLKEVTINRNALKRLVIFVVATFLYVRLIEYLGFILLTPFYVFFACWFFKYEKLVVAAIVSIVATGTLYYIFLVLFFVMLPEFRLF